MNDIVELAKEIQDSYEKLKNNRYNEYDYFRGKNSKAYCLRLIDLLRLQLLEMKGDIKNGGRN